MICIDFIIISYNTKNITIQAIESIYNSFALYKSSNPLIEDVSTNSEIELGNIIIIDNNSNDGTLEAIEGIYNLNEKVKTVKLSENLGYAKACNIGIKESINNYFVIMNSDIIVLKNTLLGIEKSLKLDFTLIGFQQLYPNLVLQRSYGYYPSIKSSILKLFAYENIKNLFSKYKFNKYTRKLNLILDKDNFFLEYITNFKKLKNNIIEFEDDLLHLTSQKNKSINIKKVEYLDGAFLLFDKLKLTESKLLFDENYFFYSEEMDLCYNLNKLNYKVLFNPNYFLIHYRGFSLENNDINDNNNDDINNKKIIDNLTKSISLLQNSNLYFCQKHYNKNVTKFYFYCEYLFRIFLVIKDYLFFSNSNQKLNKNKIHLKVLKKIIKNI